MLRAGNTEFDILLACVVLGFLGVGSGRLSRLAGKDDEVYYMTVATREFLRGLHLWCVFVFVS